MIIRAFCLIIMYGWLAGCDLSRLSDRKTAHQRYAAGLRKADLDQQVLGKAWLAAADQCLKAPLTVSLPYREEGYFASERPRAVCYRFSLKQGQRVSAVLAYRPVSGVGLFADLFRPAGDAAEPLLLAGTDTAGTLSYEAEEDGELLLRLQPELLAAVSYELTISTGPSLAFPVSGGKPSDIGSVWGDPRDAGARRHEGIDIFGTRGTPLVAAADGLVTRTGDGGIGGKVVWMKPTGRKISLYYAHLDAHRAKAGQQIKAGDTLGLMGNSGNARTTPPHLHFGIYGIGGAINPLPFIRPDNRKPMAILGDRNLLNTQGRMRSAQDLLVSLPPKTNLTRTAAATPVIVHGLSGAYYIVSLPDGTTGFLPATAVGPLVSLNQEKLRSAASLLHGPDSGSAIVGRLRTGNAVEVLGRHSGFTLVRHGDATGWVADSVIR